jgi:hypothetical protein
MPKPQCHIYGELESRREDARKELFDVIEVLEQSDPDDRPDNQSNVGVYKEQYADRGRELDAHVAACEECQKDN